jgi:hypothetical protein
MKDEDKIEDIINIKKDKYGPFGGSSGPAPKIMIDNKSK